MSDSDTAAARFSPRLQEFLAGPAGDEDWRRADADPDLASSELFVEEPVLGRTTSRFVKEGGVRLIRVTNYRITPEDLPELARRRPDLKQKSLVLVKFWLMFDELPTNRQYATIRIRISLAQPADVLLLDPDLETSSAEAIRTSTSGFTPGIAKPLQLAMSRTRSESVRRTETVPVATAVDHGSEGFGWTYQAQNGAPLLWRREITHALLELPAGTTEVAGLLEAEAQISRQLLGTVKTRRATPLNAAAPFLVSLRDDG